MSLRSKVVIESNLKPSQFGKPASAADKSEDDFEEIYENPLEKSKPLPPRVISAGDGVNTEHQELPRNEPEIMEFSNASKNVGDSNKGIDLSAINRNGKNRDERISTLDKPTNPTRTANIHSQRDSKDSNSAGYTNEGFDQEKNTDKNYNAGGNGTNEKLVTIENGDDGRTNIPNSSDNEKNDGSPADDNPDISFQGIINVIKSLDVNRYATKKTIAQGMLDIALLTANASQLKYILQIGKQHEFYILMLSLICVSIGLQVIQGVICVLLGSSLNINKQQDQKKANIWNNICLIMMVLTVAVNAVISAFDMRDNSALTQANATRGTASIQLASGGR